MGLLVSSSINLLRMRSEVSESCHIDIHKVEFVLCNHNVLLVSARYMAASKLEADVEFLEHEQSFEQSKSAC